MESVVVGPTPKRRLQKPRSDRLLLLPRLRCDGGIRPPSLLGCGLVRAGLATATPKTVHAGRAAGRGDVADDYRRARAVGAVTCANRHTPYSPCFKTRQISAFDPLAGFLNRA